MTNSRAFRARWTLRCSNREARKLFSPRVSLALAGFQVMATCLGLIWPIFCRSRASIVSRSFLLSREFASFCSSSRRTCAVPVSDLSSCAKRKSSIPSRVASHDRVGMGPEGEGQMRESLVRGLPPASPFSLAVHCMLS